MRVLENVSNYNSASVLRGIHRQDCLQRKRSIRTDQIAKREKQNKTFYIELLLKIAIYSVVPVEAVSILAEKTHLPIAAIITGKIWELRGILFLQLRSDDIG